MKSVEWIDNKELYNRATGWTETDFDAIEELERRLRLSGFFDMPLEFYLRELWWEFNLTSNGERFECYSVKRDVEFFGKTALEAAKAAYEWKNSQK